MPHISDQAYLLNEQYKDASNLDARVQLHLLFSTNSYGWQRWCFDQYALPVQARVLELGCGPAHLWTTNLQRVPPGWHITLSDLSHGMLDQARCHLGLAAQTSPLADRPAPHFAYEIIDAQAIPFDDASCEAVIANHMLYHVPNRAQALAEMRRVLKPGSQVYLATNGLAHLRELHELERRFDPAVDFGWGRTVPERFSLDNGGAEVAYFFQEVHLVRYADALAVTEAEPLVNYILSMATTAALRERRVELQRFIEHELAQQGAIHITKESGMFIGKKGDSSG